MKSPQSEKRYSISFGLGPLIYGILSYLENKYWSIKLGLMCERSLIGARSINSCEGLLASCKIMTGVQLYI